MNKKILYIWDSDYPWDVRTEKICRSLSMHGYEVHIAARNQKRRAVYEKKDSIHIHRMRTWANEKLNYALSFPAFFSPVWKKFINSIIEKNNINLVIVRDLPLAPLGINCAKKSGIPCIFDMAEDYVAMLHNNWSARKFEGLNLVVRNPYFAKPIANYSFKYSDHILVVVEDAIDVVFKGGASLDKVTVVSNTPELATIYKGDTGVIANEYLKKIREHFSAIYVGGIQMGRGIQTVLDAIPQIIERIPDFLFVVVGDGYAANYFKEIIKKKQLANYVQWVGWVKHEQIYDFINVSKIGLIPHLVTEHVKTTIPNKIFDYMGLGLPIISSDAPPMERILKKEQCGLSYHSGDSYNLYQCVTKIHSLGVQMGENGKKAVLEKYNWQHEEEDLVKVVKSFLDY